MAKEWTKVTITVQVPGTRKNKSKEFLISADLLSDPASQGNDHRQNIAMQHVANAFIEVYREATKSYVRRK